MYAVSVGSDGQIGRLKVPYAKNIFFFLLVEVGADFWTSMTVLHPYGTAVWRTIRNLWPKIISNSKIKVGHGGKTLFWEDIWVGNQTLKSRFTVL